MQYLPTAQENSTAYDGCPRTVPTEIEKLTTAWASEGKTVLYAVAEGQVLGAFALEDEIRPESYEAVKGLHRLGIRVATITGDSKTVANSVARRIGIIAQTRF